MRLRFGVEIQEIAADDHENTDCRQNSDSSLFSDPMRCVIVMLEFSGCSSHPFPSLIP
jgi:hypothetical protein